MGASILLVLVVVLVLEIPCKIEEEDEPKPGVFHTGSEGRAPAPILIGAPQANWGATNATGFTLLTTLDWPR